MADENMTDEDIIALCKSLANRYKRPHLFDDLVSEGILACYECRDKGKKGKKAYVGAARTAMHNFVNIKSKSVSIPPTWASKTVSHAMSVGKDIDNLDGVTEATLALLLNAMKNEGATLDEVQSYVDGEDVFFEKREFEAYLLGKIRSHLDDEEWELLVLLADDDVTQGDVAQELNLSPQAISLRLKRIQNKAHKAVTKSELLLWRE